MAQTDGVLSLIIKLSCSLEQDTFLNFFYSRATSSQLYFSLLILCLPTSNTVCEQILGQDARKVEGPQGFSEGSSVAPCGVSPHMLCWLQALAVRGSSWRLERSTNLGLWGTPSRFQQCFFCLSWLPFLFHQLHPGNAKWRGGKRAEASDVLLQTEAAVVPRLLLSLGEAWLVSRVLGGSEQKEVSSYTLLLQKSICKHKRAGTSPQSHCQP